MRNPFRKKYRLLRNMFNGLKDVVSISAGLGFHGLGLLSGRYRRRKVLHHLREGDIILASPKTLQLSPNALLYRLFLRSKFVHSMLYLGQGKMIHVTARRGVTIDVLPRKIYRSDRYSIYTAENITDAQRRHIIGKALQLKGTKLDHAGLWTNVPTRLFGLKKPLLSFEKSRLWCSKLIHLAYLAAGINLVDEQNSANVTSEDLSASAVLQRVH